MLHEPPLTFSGLAQLKSISPHFKSGQQVSGTEVPYISRLLEDLRVLFWTFCIC